MTSIYSVLFFLARKSREEAEYENIGQKFQSTDISGFGSKVTKMIDIIAWFSYSTIINKDIVILCV